MNERELEEPCVWCGLPLKYADRLITDAEDNYHAWCYSYKKHEELTAKTQDEA